MKKIYLGLSVLSRLLIKTIFVAIFQCVLVAAAYAAEPLPLGHQMSVVKSAPLASDFALPDIDGDQHKLSDLRGQVVMLNFWGTWCPPCRREMPSMERLYTKYKDRGLTVVAVNQWEDEDTVFEFTGRLSLPPTFLILLDRESRVSEQYAVKGLPTTYLIDKAGKIRYRAMGGREFDHPEVEKLIEGLLD